MRAQFASQFIQVQKQSAVFKSISQNVKLPKIQLVKMSTSQKDNVPKFYFGLRTGLEPGGGDQPLDNWQLKLFYSVSKNAGLPIIYNTNEL